MVLPFSSTCGLFKGNPHTPHHADIGLPIITTQPQLGQDDLVVTFNHPPHATAFTVRKVPEKQPSIFLGKRGLEDPICNGQPSQLVQTSSQPVALATKLVLRSPPNTGLQITPLCQKHQAGILLTTPTSIATPVGSWKECIITRRGLGILQTEPPTNLLSSQNSNGAHHKGRCKCPKPV